MDTLKPNTKIVGQRIKNIRQNKGLSMDEFGNLIDGKAQSGAVANWETGKNLPNSKRLKRIADIGNITIDELLYGNMQERIADFIAESIEYNNKWIDNPNKYEKEQNPNPEYNMISYLYDTALMEAERVLYEDVEIDELSGDEKKEFFSNLKDARKKIALKILSDVEEELNEKQISTPNKDNMKDAVINVLERIVTQEEYNNEGFINFIESSIKNIIQNEALIYFFKEDDTERDLVSNSLFDEVHDILTEAIEKINALKNKY